MKKAGDVVSIFGRVRGASPTTPRRAARDVSSALRAGEQFLEALEARTGVASSPDNEIAELDALKERVFAKLGSLP